VKLPRFHLSTLLLCCIFAGAVIGLCFTPPVWQRLSRQEERQWFKLLNENHFGEFSGPGGSVKIPYDSVYDEETGYDYESRVWSFTLINKTTGEKTTVKSEFHPSPVCELSFSLDHQIVFKAAEGKEGSLEFYRRTRPYGLRGFFGLPLIWIAALSFLMLAVIAARRIFKK
jgi:hypothetical protein